MGKASQRKKAARSLTHLVQARLTAVSEKHVCLQCGADAHVLDVAYEVISQAQANQLNREVKQQQTLDDMMRTAQMSSTSDAVYLATLREQHKGPPQEHSRSYRCFSCMTSLLSASTGIPNSGEAVVGRLLSSPPSHAVFVVRNVDDPTRTLLLNTPFQDAPKLLQILRHEAALPQMELTTLEAEKHEME